MTEQKPEPPHYGARALGLSTCGFGTGNPECGQPAIVHALFDIDECHNGLMCDRHWSIFMDKFAYVDVHPFGGACTMPGAVWVHSTITHTVGDQAYVAGGGCTIPLEEDETA